jgi:hypothetical protein
VAALCDICFIAYGRWFPAPAQDNHFRVGRVDGARVDFDGHCTGSSYNL